MNRRCFIKSAAGVAVAPSVLTGLPVTMTPSRAPRADRFTVECCTHEVNSLEPYKHHCRVPTEYVTVEDAVQDLFEHVKGFDLRQVDVSYNILYHSEDNRIIQAGYYAFRYKDTLCITNCATGWHGSPKYTDYYAVESA